MFKKFLRSAAGQFLISRLVFFLIRFTLLTTRWTVIGEENRKKAVNSGQPVIGAFWHNRIMLAPAFIPKGQPLSLLLSMHADGQLIARAVELFGIKTIAGSTSRQGAQALRKMLKALKAGEHIVITPDGPRGPRMRCAPGIVTLARMSGVPVVPVTWNVEHRKPLGSWDRFIFARPFSRGVMIWGDPIHVPAELDDEWSEAYRRQIEDALNADALASETFFGHTPLEPAAPEIARKQPA